LRAEVVRRAEREGAATRWLESFVANDKISSVYAIPDEASVREH
jgi:hypothetical protein